MGRSKHKIGFLEMEMQIHSLPRGGALRAAAEIKVVRSPGNGCKQSSTGLINAVLSGKMKWKCQQYVSEDRRFPPEIHSHKDIRAVFWL